MKYNFFKINKFNIKRENNKHMTMLIIFSFYIILCPITLNSQGLKEVSDGSGKVENKVEKVSEKNGFSIKDYSEDDFKPQLEEESYVWLVVKTVIVLGMLVGGFYFFFRFVTKQTGTQVLGGDVLQILAVSPIGQNKYLQVIDLAGKIIVLGVSDNNINLITEITDKDEIDKIRLLSSRTVDSTENGFQGVLAKHLGNIIDKVVSSGKGVKKNQKTDQFESGVDLNYLKQQRKRLKNLNEFDDE